MISLAGYTVLHPLGSPTASPAERPARAERLTTAVTPGRPVSERTTPAARPPPLEAVMALVSGRRCHGRCVTACRSSREQRRRHSEAGTPGGNGYCP